MSKVLKVIGNILLVLFIVVAAAQLVPPLVGVTTVVATPQVTSNMQVGSVAYGWRKNLNTFSPGDQIVYSSDKVAYVYEIVELDPATGRVIHPEADEAAGVDPYFGKRLLGGGHQSIEGPYILYDAESGWYYLFVSYGGLNAHGGYQIRVFRSRAPDGDYEDMNGARPGKMAHALYGLKLSGNYTLPSVRTAYMATGHNSAFVDEDGKRYVCYHTRFNNGTESHLPMVKQFAVSEEGWPCLLPYSTRKETIPAEFSAEDVPGRYYVVNQGTEINDVIAEPFILYLRPDGSVGGESAAGSWALADHSVYLRLSLGDTSWSGIICRMQDNAGTEVTVFTLAGQNESVWGVKYDEQ